MVNYIAKANAARFTRVSGTTLFQVAADYLNDATQWNRIADLNGLIDPWIYAVTVLQLPAPLPAVAQGNDGILGNQTSTKPISLTPPVAAIPVPAPIPSSQSIPAPAPSSSIITAWILSLPTSLPATPGIAWNNSGVISIS
jgi:hypothetical protein